MSSGSDAGGSGSDRGPAADGGAAAPSRRPSLKDVAELAGVSFQTASKVLRGGGSVAADTRRRIVAAADDLGYVPDAVARSLVTMRTRTIGALVGDLSDHVVGRFVVGAEREANRGDHGVLIVSVDSGDEEGKRSLRALLERRVDGVVTAAPQLERDARLGAVLRDRLPAVSIHAIAGGGVSMVGSDQRAIGRLATDHLTALGHTRIGTITGKTTRRATRSRTHGYTTGLRAAGIAVDDALVVEGDWQPGGGYAAAHTLLARSPRVTALVVQNDLMAVGVLHAAHERGLAVPDDLAVVGCDDIPIAAHTIPALTTVHVPFAETGATAVRMLLDQLAEPVDEPVRVLLPVRLVCRQTCGCGATAAGRPAS